MLKFLPVVAMAIAGFTAPTVMVAQAASFDCAKASTPFEHAICDNPELSRADERLSKTYETAIGGLSKAALDAVRADQRTWLDYAQKACTSDAKPMAKGSYSENGVSCLVDIFSSRSQVLETSRMMDGRRFYPQSRYAALPDPYEADDPDSNWPVAQHEQTLVQLDSSEPYAVAFNEFVRKQGEVELGMFAAQGGEGDGQDDDTSNTDNKITVQEQAGTGRISLAVNTYWYGHGAAHGNYSLSYLHYLVDEKRGLEATDMFTGKGWEKKLTALTLAALQAEHGDNLMLDDNSNVVALVAVDPTRWDFSDDYGLLIQFEPYEVSAYAYGAPTARVSWTDLEPYLSEKADKIRYGY